jgi:hypothetical protein
MYILPVVIESKCFILVYKTLSPQSLTRLSGVTCTTIAGSGLKRISLEWAVWQIIQCEVRGVCDGLFFVSHLARSIE